MHLLRRLRRYLPGKRDLSGRYAVSDRSGRLHRLRRLRRRLPGRRDQAGRVILDGHSVLRGSVPRRLCAPFATEYGDIAHLVERLNGIQEVDGSSPFISTKRELSEHHYYRTVGSGSFFIAAEGIRALSIKKPSRSNWPARLFIIVF